MKTITEAIKWLQYFAKRNYVGGEHEYAQTLLNFLREPGEQVLEERKRCAEMCDRCCVGLPLDDSWHIQAQRIKQLIESGTP